MTNNQYILVVCWIMQYLADSINLFSFFEVGSHYIAQAGLELLESSDPPASASHLAGTTGTWATTLGTISLKNKNCQCTNMSGWH
jgi:hypothetical protein